MATAWWNEFQERDGQAGALKVKLRTLFRGSITPVFRRMFESPDDFLSLQPPLAPDVWYSWLPNPSRCVETDERLCVLGVGVAPLTARRKLCRGNPAGVGYFHRR